METECLTLQVATSRRIASAGLPTRSTCWGDSDLLLEDQEAAPETISNNGKGLEREEPSRVMRTETLRVDMLEVGDVVRVVTGSSPPSDGTVVSEETTFDESSLTGESKPVTKSEGDREFAGTINQTKAVSVRVDMGNGGTM
jgi:P-type E1-E2 ATPase